MFLDGRQYYFISFIIIALAVCTFIFSFERRKPKAREIVVLAVMTTIAIVSRVMFFMIPEMKPSAAIIIITGAMLGKQAGFLSGVLTAFFSDFVFGQGPWTPWQMIGFGLVGLGAAIIFYGRESLCENRILLCGYGFFATMLIYGLLMDTATVFMSVDQPTKEAFIDAYLAGIVINCIHGITTVAVLWFLSRPMFHKLQRIKIKYGMYYRMKS
ncbi:MAG: ECF transporter S component [Eubacterium sp.]|nr:ECF transporter S component [Eubacterium sp.]